MQVKQKEMEKDLGLILRDNKCLTELLSKAEEEITEVKKKMNGMKKGSDVGVNVCQF